MNYQLIQFMATDKLPKECRPFPFNFLYAFFKLCVEELRLERKESTSHKKPLYEMYEFNNGKHDAVIIFEKQGEKVTLKFYFKKLSDPNFETNCGFDDQFTSQNLSIITCDNKKTLKLWLSGNTEVELNLDPLKTNIGTAYPFEGTIKFNAWFWKSYKEMMDKEFAQMADN